MVAELAILRYTIFEHLPISQQLTTQHVELPSIVMIIDQQILFILKNILTAVTENY